MTLLSAALLCLAVLSYGFAGARLSVGAKEEGSPLRSRAWWTGTGLQGAGFLLALGARYDLPLLIVQPSVVAAIVVTAVVQQFNGVRRLRAGDLVAALGTVAGLAVIGFATVPGPADGDHLAMGALLTACIAVAGLVLLAPPGVLLSGTMAGIGFAVAAVAARLFISHLPDPLWAPWAADATFWVMGWLVVGGLGLGQTHLTRGLSAAPALPVLASMYIVSTVLPAGIGLWILDEELRDGWTGWAVVGIVVATGAALSMLRGEPEDVAPPVSGPADGGSAGAAGDEGDQVVERIGDGYPRRGGADPA